MKYFVYLSLAFCLVVTNAFYQHHKELAQHQSLVSMPVSMIKQSNKKMDFPAEFRYNLKNSEGEQLQYHFAKVEDSVDTEVFYKNDNNEIVKASSEVEHMLYRDKENKAVAALIRNSDLEDVTAEHEFRMLLHTMDEKTGAQYDVHPIVVENPAGPSTVHHTVNKRNIDDNTDIIDDSIDIAQFEQLLKNENSKQREASKLKSILKPENILKREANDNRIQKRAVNGQPVQLYVEYLVVTDASVLAKYMKLLNRNDTNLVMSYMRIYFSHVLNAVNQRYLLSLQNDADLRIQVVLRGLYIETSAGQSNWSNPAVVGDPAYPTYNNLPVVVTSKTLTAFTSYMMNLNLPIAYDHAVGMFSKDLWGDNTTISNTPAARTGVVGYATVGGICLSNYKFSIVEERGFNSISVMAHELGHNLGAGHDLSLACPASNNNIMAAVLGSPSNLANVWYFSSCSISSFKTLLLRNNSVVSTRGQCLTNTPTNLPIENTYFSTYYPGQIWTADQQCRMLMNDNACNAIYCGVNNGSCATVWCYKAGYCYSVSGWGLLDGTPCGVNKACLRGSCVPNTFLSVPNPTSTPCAVNPCQNGGVCTQTYNLYVCTCPTGFTGQNCEVAITTTTPAVGK